MSSQETEIEEKVCEDRISALPEDLLVQILSLVLTKDAVNTMLVSKRWHFVWTMVPKLDYMVTDEGKENFSDFLDKSMQHHKAPVLESFRIRCDNVIPDGVYVRKWVSNAVKRCVRELTLELYSRSNPNNLPACLYTSKTLVNLTLSNNIIIDVPPQACLPSLQSLTLDRVVYKDIDSQFKLLSSCPVLKDLDVSRDSDSNETTFNVKVPCLERLTYISYGEKSSGSFLVIDSPRLHQLTFIASSVDDCSIQNMPHLDKASINLCFGSHQNGKLLRSISSVKYLGLVLNELQVTFCSAINFSRLIELQIFLLSFGSVSNWLETLTLLLNNTSKLKVLIINNDYNNAPQLSWNQPSSVPPSLLSRLEIFGWKGFEGLREEKEFVAYIFSNAKCLKTAGISLESLYNHVMEKKIKEELESMYRVSASSKLLFSANLKWRYRK